LPELIEDEYEAVLRELHHAYDVYLPELPPSTLELHDPDAADDEEFEEQYLQENGMFLGNMGRGYVEEEEDEEEEEEEDDTMEDDGKRKDEGEDELEGDEDAVPPDQATIDGNGDTCVPGQAADDFEAEEDQFVSEQATTEADAFDYKKPCGRSLSAQEILSFSLSNIYAEFGIPRRCIQKINAVLRSVLPKELAPFDERTVTKHRSERTGIKAVKYDCCINSCMSYAMYPDATECMVCSHPRWKETEDFRAPGGACRSRKPFAQHTYVPVAHRLKLAWSDAQRANLMLRYRNMAGLARENGQCSDFWSADLMCELQEKDSAPRPMFSQDTDIAFFLSSDGVKVFKSRRAFYIWPLLLINLNLPPDIRLKKSNMMLVGFIPGPKEPQDVDSFLYPLVQEFKKLREGVPAYNAARKHLGAGASFNMRAYITIVGADMIGRAKLMHTVGNRCYSYCEHCGARGIWNGSIYCPFTPPADAPDEAKNRPGSGYPWGTLNRTQLPLRNDTVMCTYA
jgi:hypothetical protein